MSIKTMSAAVAILLSAACAMTALSSDGEPGTSIREEAVTLEEYGRMVDEAAAEIRSETGMSYGEYCSYIEGILGSVIYIHNVDGTVTAEIVDTIDAGRTGFEWRGNGFDIYLDSYVVAGGTAAIVGAMTSAMPAIAAVLAGTVAAVVMQYLSENDTPNGVVLHYGCYWTVNTPFGSFNIYHTPVLEYVGAQ